MKKKLLLVLLGVFSLSVLVAKKENKSATKPNIILILSDDVGWTDTSVRMMKGMEDSKSDFYQTPTLAKMASQGLTFSNAYASSSVCSPSRVSIQFGKTPTRLQHTTLGDVLQKKRGLSCADEIAIPTMIKNTDPSYKTAHFGKWGFHFRKPYEYDVSDGETGNGQGTMGDDKKPLPADNPKRTFEISNRAVQFLDEQVKEGNPFFMQLSYYAAHVPNVALEKTVEKYKKLPPGKKSIPEDYQQPYPDRNEWMLMFAAMIEDLDNGIGQVISKVEELGISDNTYIIFTSDNGGEFRGNKPLVGRKTTLWEGGIRVPMIVTGPGVLKNEYCDIPVAAWDFYATINHIVGGKPLPKEYDGGSLVELFEKGNAGQVERGTNELVFHYPWYGGDHNFIAMDAIRDGDYKLVRNVIADEWRLHNVVEDIGELNDLKDEMPEKFAELKSKLNNYLKEANAADVYDVFQAAVENLFRGTIREMKKPNPNQELLDRQEDRRQTIINKLKPEYASWNNQRWDNLKNKE
jgi:arylsulfatase A-like enzyme